MKAWLELFVVCQAVQHAHQKGIIHRDLKPGNVLVTEVDGRPTPKVIDFGGQGDRAEKLTDASFADTSAIVGTPTYMSLEQADPTSMDIDTRIDVYALGVMLYELLTGLPPLTPASSARRDPRQMLRMVREVDRPGRARSSAPPKPCPTSRRIGVSNPAVAGEAVAGGFDWAVTAALKRTAIGVTTRPKASPATSSGSWTTRSSRPARPAAATG
ncbi:MAG: protein kinase [Isosphaeraceae bacterium]